MWGKRAPFLASKYPSPSNYLLTISHPSNSYSNKNSNRFSYLRTLMYRLQATEPCLLLPFGGSLTDEEVLLSLNITMIDNSASWLSEAAMNLQVSQWSVVLKRGPSIAKHPFQELQSIPDTTCCKLFMFLSGPRIQERDKKMQ